MHNQSCNGNFISPQAYIMAAVNRIEDTNQMELYANSYSAYLWHIVLPLVPVYIDVEGNLTYLQLPWPPLPFSLHLPQWLLALAGTACQTPHISTPFPAQMIFPHREQHTCCIKVTCKLAAFYVFAHKKEVKKMVAPNPTCHSITLQVLIFALRDRNLFAVHLWLATRQKFCYSLSQAFKARSLWQGVCRIKAFQEETEVGCLTSWLLQARLAGRSCLPIWGAQSPFWRPACSCQRLFQSTAATSAIHESAATYEQWAMSRSECCLHRAPAFRHKIRM